MGEKTKKPCLRHGLVAAGAAEKLASCDKNVDIIAERTIL